MIKGDAQHLGDKQEWGAIWKGNVLLPKLRLFLWRCFWKATPVQAVLAIRIIHLLPICKLCGMNDETIMHEIFKCDFASAAWFASPMGIRTENLTGTFRETVLAVRSSATQQQFSTFVSVTWAIWQVRNMLFMKTESLASRYM